ncbi:MAG: CBS domain containing-hemolysin-like protein [Flavobacteriales bacterium]|jgi:putative hemolysin
MEIDGAAFEASKGDSDTLAGFILEQFGKIPLKGERLQFEDLLLTVEASDRRRIKRIKVSREEKEQSNDFID